MSVFVFGSDDNDRDYTHSRGSVIILAKGKGDRTVRPRRPGIPRFWPKDVPFPPSKKEPPKQEPPPQADQA